MEDLEKMSLSDLIDKRVEAEKAVLVFAHQASLSLDEQGFDEFYEKSRQMRTFASMVSLEIRKRLIDIQKIIGEGK